MVVAPFIHSCSFVYCSTATKCRLGIQCRHFFGFYYANQILSRTLREGENIMPINQFMPYNERVCKRGASSTKKQKKKEQQANFVEFIQYIVTATHI